MKILIQKAHVISPKDQIDDVLDILIENTKIKSMKKDIPVKEDYSIIDGRSKILMPYFIEIPCFAFRKSKKANDSQIKSAIAGGFLHLVMDSSYAGFIDSNNEYLSSLKINYFLKTEHFNKLNHESIDQKKYLALVETRTKVSKYAFRKIDIFNYAERYKIPLFLESKDPVFSKKSYVYEGEVAYKKGFYPLSPLGQILSITRNIEIARQLETDIHIYQVNLNQSLKNIQSAKKDSVPVTSSIPSYYLEFFEEDFLSYPEYNNLKVYPPLIKKDDVQFIVEHIKNDTINFIPSGDEPRSEGQKNSPFESAKKGMINFETHFSILYEKLVKKNNYSLSKLVKKLSVEPFEILKIPSPSIQEGSCANFILFDSEFPMSGDKIVSKFKNTPFLKKKWKGAIVYVIGNGKLIFDRYLNKFFKS